MTLGAAGLTRELGHPVNQDTNILGCIEGSFPQTYLGLLLSNEKLNLATFAPIIANAD
jgi:hypothetical protein